MGTKRRWAIVLVMGAVALAPTRAWAMHISEGLLPPAWAGLWWAVALPFVAWGVWDLQRRSARDPRAKALVGLAGAAVFIISCMPVPVPGVGSCSHPCGTGMAAILIGPAPTILLASVALTFQALFLAHGGLSTLGANIVSMGVVGALVGYGVFRVGLKARLPVFAAAFLAGLLSDWATYATTAFELAASLHWDGNLWGVFGAIVAAFAPTQIPLGLAEGVISAFAYNFVRQRRPEMLAAMTGGRDEAAARVG